MKKKISDNNNHTIEFGNIFTKHFQVYVHKIDATVNLNNFQSRITHVLYSGRAKEYRINLEAANKILITT